jgi:hypothetical protein
LLATATGLAAGCLGDSEPSTPGTDSPAATDSPVGTVGTPSPIAEGATVHVDDYGATPDDDSDDTDAVVEAVLAAADASGTVEFSAGTYYCASTDTNYRNVLYAPLFDLVGVSGLTVRGNGATIQQQNWGPTFMLKQCTDITVEDLTIDWKHDPPDSEGFVVEETADYVDLELREPFEARDGIRIQGFFPYDTERERITAPFYVQKPSPTEGSVPRDGVLRCPKSDLVADEMQLGLPGGPRPLQEGDGMVIRHKSQGGNPFRVYETSGLTLRNIRVPTAPGVGLFATGYIENPTLENIDFTPHENWWHGISSGGCNVGGPTGDVTVRNVEVAHTGDDHLNLRVDRYDVVAVPESNAITFEFGLSLVEELEYNGFHPGDEITVTVAPDIYDPAFTATIEDTTLETNMRTDWAGNGRLTLQLDSTVPDAVRAADRAQVYNSSRLPDRALVENFTARAIRGGTRIRVPNVTIRDSLFQDIGGPGVWFGAQEWAGAPATDCTVENTTVRRAPYQPRSSGGALHVANASGSGGTITGLTVEGNTFEHDQEKKAVRLADIADSSFSDNDLSGMPASTPVTVTVASVDCETVTWDGESVCERFGG